MRAASNRLLAIAYTVRFLVARKWQKKPGKPGKSWQRLAQYWDYVNKLQTTVHCREDVSRSHNVYIDKQHIDTASYSRTKFQFDLPRMVLEQRRKFLVKYRLSDNVCCKCSVYCATVAFLCFLTVFLFASIILWRIKMSIIDGRRFKLATVQHWQLSVLCVYSRRHSMLRTCALYSNKLDTGHSIECKLTPATSTDKCFFALCYPVTLTFDLLT